MSRACLILILVLGLSPTTFAQDPKPSPKASKTPRPKLSRLLKAAFKMRREGQFTGAAVALESIFERLDRKSKHRYPIALELAQVLVVSGKPYRAVVVYRKLRDTPREISTLLSMKDEKKTKEALTIARLDKYALGEAQALIQLGQKEEALKVLAKGGKALAKERGELLLELKRYAEAEAAFTEIEDYYGKARALKLQPGKQRDAKRAFEDAAAQIKLQLSHEVIPTAKAAKKVYSDKSLSGARVERARFFLAQSYGQVGEGYQRWARAAAGAGDKVNAAKRQTKALKYFRLQKSTLTSNNADKYGIAAAEKLGVNAAIQAATKELASYAGS